MVVILDRATSKRFNKTTWDEKQVKRKEQKELRAIVQGIRESQKQKVKGECRL